MDKHPLIALYDEHQRIVGMVIRDHDGTFTLWDRNATLVAERLTIAAALERVGAFSWIVQK